MEWLEYTTGEPDVITITDLLIYYTTRFLSIRIIIRLESSDNKDLKLSVTNVRVKKAEQQMLRQTKTINFGNGTIKTTFPDSACELHVAETCRVVNK